MNLIHAEIPYDILAKTCGCNDECKRVVYFVDNYDNLYRNKKDIVLAEMDACERLLKNTIDGTERKVIEMEIDELKIVLDLIQ